MIAALAGLLAAATAAAAGEAPTVLATGQTGVMKVVVDGRDIYWAAEGGIFRAPRDGGPARRFSDKTAADLAIDGTAIYAPAETQLWKFPRDGSAPVKLVATDEAITSVAVDGVHVYFGQRGTAASLRRVAKGGGSPEKLAEIPKAGVGHIVLDGTHAYFTLLRWTGEGGAIMRIAKARGAKLETVYDGERVAGGFAADATHVYFTLEGTREKEHRDGKLLRVLKGGMTLKPAARPEIISSGLFSPWDLALDGGFVYVAEQGSILKRSDLGSVTRVAIAGGSRETVAARQGGPYSLALEGGRVYWAAFTDGAIRSLPLLATRQR